MMQIRVAAVIVNYNGARWNFPCLASLKKCGPLLRHIVFVDNASNDNSLQAVLARYGDDNRFVFLPQSQNLLFAAGCNRGMETSLSLGADYLLLINNDTLLEEGCLELLCDYLQQHQEVAAVQPLLVRLDDPQTLASAGCRVAYTGMAWDAECGQPLESLPNAPFSELGVTGGASLWRADALRQIGLFDENFGMYFEDVDLSLRARRHGWQLFTLPSAHVRHACGGTSTEEAPSYFCVRWCERNAAQLICKHWPAVKVLPALLTWLFVSLTFCVSSVRQWNLPHTRALVCGICGGLAQIPHCLMQRMRNRGEAKESIWRWVSARLVPPRV